MRGGCKKACLEIGYPKSQQFDFPGDTWVTPEISPLVLPFLPMPNCVLLPKRADGQPHPLTKHSLPMDDDGWVDASSLGLGGKPCKHLHIFDGTHAETASTLPVGEDGRVRLQVPTQHRILWPLKDSAVYYDTSALEHILKTRHRETLPSQLTIMVAYEKLFATLRRSSQAGKRPQFFEVMLAKMRAAAGEYEHQRLNALWVEGVWSDAVM